MSETNGFEGWAILELMGHRKLAGKLSEQAIGGASMVRIDVPGEGDTIVATQFYSGSAIYCITPTTEEIARKVATHHQPAPVQRWEMPDRPALTAHAANGNDDGDECHGDDDMPY